MKTSMIYTFKVQHEYQFKALIEIAKLKDLSICETYLEEGREMWSIFQFNVVPDEGYHIVGCQHTTGAEIKSLEKMIDILYNTTIESLKLTKDYTAILDRENFVVRVGCQEIPFNKVKELYDLIIKN